ncbi:MAG: TIM barrel protein [Thermoguttaceae bacterium]|jgi:hydroxypyruvate isomerase
MSNRSDRLTRRRMMQAGAATVATAAAGSAAVLGAGKSPGEETGQRVVTRGRIRQSVVSWCYAPMKLETLARHAAAIGLQSVENVDPKDFGILQRYGLVCGMTVGHLFVDGMNRKENHAMCIEKLKACIDANGQAGYPNVITFSGMRRGMPDDVGLDNTVLGLKQVIGRAEKKKVTLCLEVLNSRVDVPMKGHPDYMCDKVEWAAEVCKRIGSERMKILFDIYHVQIMQGDIITRIRQYHEYIGHYHVAGVPGRNEIDDTQEVNYAAVMRAIAATGYAGLVGQEFIPTRDPIQSLREAVRLCDV